MAYIPNTENLPEINHKDENKTNNCLQNLEWCDRKYNNNYGTHIEKIKKPVLQYTLNGEFVREWQSATDVGIVARYNINKCLKGKTKQHTASCGSIKTDINTTLLWVELYIFTYFR